MVYDYRTPIMLQRCPIYFSFRIHLASENIVTSDTTVKLHRNKIYKIKYSNKEHNKNVLFRHVESSGKLFKDYFRLSLCDGRSNWKTKRFISLSRNCGIYHHL